jgi:hypothetical protein
MDPGVLLLIVTLAIVGFALVYWAVRLGVRHGLEDRERRAVPAAEQQRTTGQG